MTDQEREEAIDFCRKMAGTANLLARLYDEAAELLEAPTVLERYFAEQS